MEAKKLSVENPFWQKSFQLSGFWFAEGKLSSPLVVVLGGGKEAISWPYILLGPLGIKVAEFHRQFAAFDMSRGFLNTVRRLDLRWNQD